MSLRVVGAGIGRTGTHSLKLALEHLLDAPCYHMLEVLSHWDYATSWRDAIDGKAIDWSVLMQGYAASVDWPAAAFWRELADAYPQAVVLLSTRSSADAWWKSANGMGANLLCPWPSHSRGAVPAREHHERVSRHGRSRYLTRAGSRPHLPIGTRNIAPDRALCVRRVGERQRMSSGQPDVTRTVLESVHTFLGGPTTDGNEWCFEFGEHVESNWGAVYGGAVAAAVLSVARCVVPDRSPRSLHLQLVRSLPRGLAHTEAAVRHAGRTVTTVQLNLYDSRHKLAATAMATMVAPDAVAADLHNTTATPFDTRTAPNPLPIKTPIHDSLQMIREENGLTLRAWGENVRPNIGGTKSPIGTITVPWDNIDSTGPEVACLAADPLVGMAVYWSGLPREVLGPNADLSLRFTTAPAARVLESSGTVLSVQHGTATVAIEVQAGDQQLAHGLSTALLLPAKS